jgi:hypothetical protein
MVNVKVASLLLGQHPLPREAARRHASCAHQCLLLGVKRTLHAMRNDCWGGKPLTSPIYWSRTTK